jgi:transcriptional regulator with GAF, ATPase, and Fis domain
VPRAEVNERIAAAAEQLIFANAMERARAETKLRQALAEIRELQDQLTAENSALRDEITQSHGFDEIVFGRFELAAGGTIFLDEVGELAVELQPKLLRVLQQGEFEQVGSSQTRRVDVRVIAATNRDLPAAISAGEFRPDLYYRLGVFPIQVPALRERREDIPLLTWFFVNRKQGKLGRRIEKIPRSFMNGLLSYAWPGNVRELENVVERAMILSRGPILHGDDVMPDAAPDEGADNGHSLQSMERAHIVSVLHECAWKINGAGNAADKLGLNPSTLRFRMKKLGIDRPAVAPATLA